MSNSYKIDLGVSLNQGDLGKIKTQLNNFQNQKKINLEINRKKIDSQLNSIRKQIQNLSNIKIDLGGSGSNNNPLGGLTKTLSDLSNVLNQFVANTGNVKTTLGSGMSGAVSSVSAVTKNIKNADIVITDTFKDVQSLKKALGQLGFEKSAIDVITKDFQELGVSVKNVTTSLRKDGNVTLTIKGIDQYERAVTIMKSVGKDGSIKSLGTSISQSFKETEMAFSRLKSLANEIGSLKVKIAGLDVDKNKSEISELTSYLNKLEAEYNELYAITSKNLNQGQLDTLTQSAQRASEKISQLNAKLTDTSSAKKQVQAFKELMTVLNQLNSKKIDLAKIGGTTSSNSNQVRGLLLEIHQLEQSYNNLLNTFNKQGIKFSADQWNQIKTAMINTGKEMDVIRAKIADVRAEMAKGIQVDLLSGNYDTELIKKLNSCCKNRYDVTISYHTPSRKEESIKNISTIRLIYKNDKVYLYGYDTDKERLVTLNLNRIKALISKCKKQGNVIPNGYSIKYKLLDYKKGMLENNERITEKQNDYVIVQGTYYNDFYAIQRVLSLKEKCVVLEPENFKEIIVEKLKEMSKIYE